MNDAPSTPEGTQLRTVELPTPDGVIRGKVAVRTGPIGLAALVPTACELTNALVQRATKLEAQASRKVSCCAGCGACCRQMVPVSPPEALYLMDLIDSFEPQRRMQIMQRFERIVNVLERHVMIGELLDPTDVGEPTLPIARKYFSLYMAWPFLVDESCSIHPHRPVACRDYNVTSPAEWCARPYDHPVAKVPLPLPLSAPLSRVAAALSGEKPCLIPLTLVPRWVSERPDLRARRWPGVELFDRFLTELKTSYGSTDA